MTVSIFLSQRRVLVANNTHVFISNTTSLHNSNTLRSISKRNQIRAIAINLTSTIINKYSQPAKESSYHTPPITKNNYRTIKSSTYSSSNNYYAVPFKLSPDEALKKFNKWCDKDQGIKILVNTEKTLISASFAPFWSFDLNLRFAKSVDDKVRYDIKPEPFSVYKNDVVYVPGLSCYAGYDYRRTLIDPVHNTSLIFSDDVVKFTKRMLQPLRISNGVMLDIGIDAWNATKGRSMELLMKGLQELDDSCKVEAQLVRSKRVYMPTYVISYSILGVQYQAFVSGVDINSDVSGVSHALYSSSTASTVQSTFLKTASELFAKTPKTLESASIFYFWIVQPILRVIFRILTKFPFVAAIMASFMTFRKLVYPFLIHQSSSADWERQRDHEAQMSDSGHNFHWDDFVDDGSAYSYFVRNKSRIFAYFNQGKEEYASEQRGYEDWFSQWTRQQSDQWRQYQDTYQQQQQNQQQQYQQKRTSTQQQKKSKEYNWEFNPDDPYAVLGISHRRGNITKEELSKIFRREMMKYHPDTLANASSEERERSTERSKLITDAYRKIKNELK